MRHSLVYFYRERSNCSESPVFSDSHLADVNKLSTFRRICDLCKDPPDPVPGGALTCKRGGGVTFVNADKLVQLRYMPELALKLYNDDKLKSFKLVKICKINRFGAGFYGLTFRAQEDGSECPVFRGIVRAVGRKRKALFCEVKDDDDDDGITLLPGDDEYLSSKRACKSEDCPPCKRKK